jgi:hypothetical protein
MRLVAVLVGLLAAASLLACGADDDEPAGTVVASSTVTVTATPDYLPLRPLESLRDVDWATPEVIRHVLGDSRVAGEVDPERVIYVDLNDDGVEEAVVVIGSGGTLADLGVAVYELDEGRARKAFFRAFTGAVDVRDGVVVIREPVYAAGEAACCPSMVRETAYEWVDEGLQQVAERTVPNRQG